MNFRSGYDLDGVRTAGVAVFGIPDFFPGAEVSGDPNPVTRSATGPLIAGDDPE